MSSDDIILRLENLVESFTPETFIYELLPIYGIPKSTMTRLKSGERNESKEADEVILKNKVYFKAVPNTVDLHTLITEQQQNEKIAKLKVRFLLVTDFKTLLAVDTKNKKSLDIPLQALPDHHGFFLPWMGKEATVIHNESLADIQASEKMAVLYDEICIVNKDAWDLGTKEHRHYLNVFLARLLFCFFAEDTEIFPVEGMFTHAIELHTEEEASDLPQFLDQLFKRLSTQEDAPFPAYLKAFPYANGGLFEKVFPIPLLNKKARRLMIECGTLDWAEINPDIFGSMIQAVVRNEARNNAKNGKASGGNTEHYTSVPNIMKVINPLFLEGLQTALAEAEGDIAKLQALHNRLQALKIFDPACGSGNFLIIAYKELRKLEISIFEQLSALQTQQTIPMPQIKLTQFYGIELDDFAHEIAMLALWLAEHQMNVAFKEVFGSVPPPLPLSKGGNLVLGNATRLDWLQVCPKEKDDEVYVLGNPPYLGSRNQNVAQKDDMAIACGHLPSYKKLDYIACWFLKGAGYIHNSVAKLAFVTTNSVCQGEQIELLWSPLFQDCFEFSFVHQSFKWANNAKQNAGVTVVIIGLRNSISSPQYLFYPDGYKEEVKKISPYLTKNVNVTVIKKRSLPLTKQFPLMSYGNYTGGCPDLILLKSERNNLLKKHPEANVFVKKFIGSDEFIKCTTRFCLWIPNESLEEALQIDEIQSRILKTKENRMKANDDCIKKLASKPHQFRDFKQAEEHSIIIPIVSSERREYIPIGFLDKNTIIPNSAQAIYDPEPWVFAVVSSKLHNAWVRAVAGRMRTDIRYSSVLCYNTFPFPEITEQQKNNLAYHALEVLQERELHSEKTIAELYDPTKMPEGLRQAHKLLDEEVELLYYSRKFHNDEERLEHLFKLYEEMIAKEQTPLFATQKKQRKGKRHA